MISYNHIGFLRGPMNSFSCILASFAVDGNLLTYCLDSANLYGLFMVFIDGVKKLPLLRGVDCLLSKLFGMMLRETLCYVLSY